MGVAASMKNDLPAADKSVCHIAHHLSRTLLTMLFPPSRSTDYYFGVVTPAIATPSEDFIDGPTTFTFSSTDQPTIVYRFVPPHGPSFPLLPSH